MALVVEGGVLAGEISHGEGAEDGASESLWEQKEQLGHGREQAKLRRRSQGWN